MTTISDRTREIALSLNDKEYADAFVSAEIATTLPFQIRAMRKAKGWRQADLARLTKQNQKTISDFENPNYARYTLRSLKKLASVFDVALVVRFAPMSELVDWAATLSASKFAVPSRDNDARLKSQQRGADDATDTTGNSPLFANVPTPPLPRIPQPTEATKGYALGRGEPPNGSVLAFKPREAA